MTSRRPSTPHMLYTNNTDEWDRLEMDIIQGEDDEDSVLLLTPREVDLFPSTGWDHDTAYPFFPLPPPAEEHEDRTASPIPTTISLVEESRKSTYWPSQISPTGCFEELLGGTHTNNNVDMMMRVDSMDDLEETKLVNNMIYLSSPNRDDCSRKHEDTLYSLPFEQRFAATFRNLHRSMIRSQSTRTSLTFPTLLSTTPSYDNFTSPCYYDRHSSVDAVRTAVQESALQLEHCMQVMYHRASDDHSWEEDSGRIHHNDGVIYEGKIL